jgi:hypothetical protein
MVIRVLCAEKAALSPRRLFVAREQMPTAQHGADPPSFRQVADATEAVHTSDLTGQIGSLAAATGRIAVPSDFAFKVGSAGSTRSYLRVRPMRQGRGDSVVPGPESAGHS